MAQSIEIKPRKRRPMNKAASKKADPILAAVAALEMDTSNEDEIAKFLAATSQGTADGKNTNGTGKDGTATQQQSRSAAKYEALNDSWLCLSVDGNDDDDAADDYYRCTNDVPLKDKTYSSGTKATATPTTAAFVSKTANAKAKEYIPPRVPIGTLERSKSGRSLRANAA